MFGHSGGGESAGSKTFGNRYRQSAASRQSDFDGIEMVEPQEKDQFLEKWKIARRGSRDRVPRSLNRLSAHQSNSLANLLLDGLELLSHSFRARTSNLEETTETSRLDLLMQER